MVSEDSESQEEETQEEEKDYSILSKEELISEFNALLKGSKVQEIKEKVEELKTEFLAKFNKELEENKEQFLAAGGNIIDFYYTTPLKKEL